MFCKNCGTKIDGAAYCPNCGQKIEEIEEIKENNVTTATKEKSAVAVNRPRSMSFILQAVLCASAIALLFFEKFAWCYEKTPFTGAHTYYQSYWNLADSLIWGLTAILLLVIPIIFSVLYFVVNKKALAFVNMGCSISALLYMIFSSVYLSELFSLSDVVVTSKYYGTMRYEYDFLSFSVLFYVILGILVVSIVVSIFDVINKPLIKIKK